MATIRKRKDIDGGNWEVMIRRVGVPHLYLYFKSYEEASQWVDENELKYIMDHTKYDFLRDKDTRRIMMWDREFENKS